MSFWEADGGSHAWSALRQSRTCISQDLRLYLRYLLGVEGWIPGTRRRLNSEAGNFTKPHNFFALQVNTRKTLTVLHRNKRLNGLKQFSLWNLLLIVLVATGVLSILNLFLSAFQNSLIGLKLWQVSILRAPLQPWWPTKEVYLITYSAETRSMNKYNVKP